MMENYNVKNVIISKQPEISENFKKFQKIVKDKKINVMVVNKGDNLKIEKDVYLQILWPDGKKFIQDNALNNNSLVFKLNYKKFSAIFTGDIEEIAEKAILNEYKDNLDTLKADILKVGHHGSKTSSTEEFIKAINSKIALIGVGENNKFGHPSNEVLKRIKSYGTNIYRTDEMGEIDILIKNTGKIQVAK